MLERFKKNPTVAAVLSLPWKGRGALVCGLARDKRIPLLARLVLPLLVLYLLTPIDLIPDFIPVIGYIDDALAILLAAWAFTKIADPAVVRDIASEVATRYPPHSDHED